MNEKLENAINSLVTKAEGAENPLFAMQYAQAVLNLTQALCNLNLRQQ